MRRSRRPPAHPATLPPTWLQDRPEHGLTKASYMDAVLGGVADYYANSRRSPDITVRLLLRCLGVALWWGGWGRMWVGGWVGRCVVGCSVAPSGAVVCCPQQGAPRQRCRASALPCEVAQCWAGAVAEAG